MNNTYSLKVKNLTELIDDHHFLLSQYYNNKTLAEINRRAKLKVFNKDKFKNYRFNLHQSF